MIIRCATAYSAISLAIYGTVLNVDTPRPYPLPPTQPPLQTPTVDDMLSGAAWKDTISSSIGGTGPYIPKILLGKFDSEEERELRLRFYQKQKRDERIKNGMTAVKMLKREGIISATVADELESKVEDDNGAYLSQRQLNPSFYVTNCPNCLCSNEKLV